MNYFRVQARLIINFNSNIVEPRNTNTRLDDHLVITTIFFRFKCRNKTLWPKGGRIDGVPLFAL